MYDHDEIVRLTVQGLSAAEIAVRVGCSTKQVARVRVARDVSRPVPLHAGRRITPDRLEAIGAMVADGVSRQDIAESLGVSWHTIARHFPGTGWSHQESGRFSYAVRRANEALRRVS